MSNRWTIPVVQYKYEDQEFGRLIKSSYRKLLELSREKTLTFITNDRTVKLPRAPFEIFCPVFREVLSNTDDVVNLPDSKSSALVELVNILFKGSLNVEPGHLNTADLLNTAASFGIDLTNFEYVRRLSEGDADIAGIDVENVIEEHANKEVQRNEELVEKNEKTPTTKKKRGRPFKKNIKEKLLSSNERSKETASPVVSTMETDTKPNAASTSSVGMEEIKSSKSIDELNIKSTTLEEKSSGKIHSSDEDFNPSTDEEYDPEDEEEFNKNLNDQTNHVTTVKHDPTFQIKSENSKPMEPSDQNRDPPLEGPRNAINPSVHPPFLKEEGSFKNDSSSIKQFHELQPAYIPPSVPEYPNLSAPKSQVNGSNNSMGLWAMSSNRHQNAHRSAPHVPSNVESTQPSSLPMHNFQSQSMQPQSQIIPIFNGYPNDGYGQATGMSQQREYSAYPGSGPEFPQHYQIQVPPHQSFQNPALPQHSYPQEYQTHHSSNHKFNPIANVPLSKIQGLQGSMKGPTVSNDGLICQLCPQTFPNNSKMWQHYIFKHFSADLKKRYIPATDLLSKTCSTCGSIFKTEVNLVLHVGVVHSKLNDIVLEKGLQALPQTHKRKSLSVD